MMETNYQNIAALIQSGASVKIRADKFSVVDLRLLAQWAVNAESILTTNLNLIAQDGSKHLTIEFA